MSPKKISTTPLDSEEGAHIVHVRPDEVSVPATALSSTALRPSSSPPRLVLAGVSSRFAKHPRLLRAFNSFTRRFWGSPFDLDSALSSGLWIPKRRGEGGLAALLRSDAVPASTPLVLIGKAAYWRIPSDLVEGRAVHRISYWSRSRVEGWRPWLSADLGIQWTKHPLPIAVVGEDGVRRFPPGASYQGRGPRPSRPVGGGREWMGRAVLHLNDAEEETRRERWLYE